MFLTITSLIVAALFGVSFTVAWRLTNENNRLRAKNRSLRWQVDEHKHNSDSLNDIVGNLINASQSEDVTYFVGQSNNGNPAVIRRSFSNGREYHTFIKGFNDDDMDFNHREAEELCDILNS